MLHYRFLVLAPFVNDCVGKCVMGVLITPPHVLTTIIGQVSLKVSHYHSTTMIPYTTCIPDFFSKSLSSEHGAQTLILCGLWGFVFMGPFSCGTHRNTWHLHAASSAVSDTTHTSLLARTTMGAIWLCKHVLLTLFLLEFCPRS